MSDRTPTTEYVLSRYCDSLFQSDGKLAEETSPEFNRWIASVRAEAVANFIDGLGISRDTHEAYTKRGERLERNRILSLLELVRCPQDCPCPINEALDELAGLIRKGKKVE